MKGLFFVFIINVFFLINPSVGYSQESPLHSFSRQGNLNMVANLLKAGADVNRQDNWGNTALMFASEHGYTNLVGHLLASGADVNQPNRFGRTPLYFATYMIKNLEMVEVLIEAGADVNHQTQFGVTALISAISMGNLEMVEVLIEAGTDVNLEVTSSHYGTLKKGQTALDIALDRAEQRGHLLEKNLEAKGFWAWLFMGIVERRYIRSLEIVKVLREAGADSNDIAEGN